MRRPILCYLVCLSTAWLTAAQAVAEVGQADSFPFQARVVSAGAAVRSGPGENFCLTDALPEGQVVEVYRQQADGWCAIRPLESSFSWVFSRHVDLMGEELGRINKDDVASRVGSRLSSQRDTVQILLKRDEVVHILGKEDHEGESWLKIAPPAGEFRWIHASSIQRDGVAESVQPTPTASWEPEAAWRPISAVNQQQSVAASEAESNGVHLTSDTAEQASTDSSKSTGAVAPQLAPTTDRQPQAVAISGDEFSRRLADVELRLSRMVARPVPTWNVAELQRETEQLLSQAATVDQRNMVKGTLSKIDQFSAIERRVVPTPGNAVAGEAGRFDAVGVLRPVVSRQSSGPQYALVDERGQVVSFVTPAPDVNLQPYLGRRIGVVGTRGFMPDLRRAHVVAGRVSPLSEKIVR